MVKAIRFHEFGGPEVLRFEEVKLGKPGPKEIVVTQTAIGVNFLDSLVREGKYPVLPELPAIPGSEGVGIIEEIGKDVENLSVGQRVAYATTIPGAYVETRLLDSNDAIAVPDNLSDEHVAASLLKGMTAEYLLKRCYKVSAGQVALVHAAAGGVGQILCQWLKHLGVTVIGTTTSEEKLDSIILNGADFAANTKKENLKDVIQNATKGNGVDVVYDSVGPDVWEESLASLRPRGFYVNYGNSSGPLLPINPVDLNVNGSLFFTKTSMRFYQLNRKELETSANDLFDVMASGAVKPLIGHRYDLRDAAIAQKAITDKRTTGSTILIP